MHGEPGAGRGGSGVSASGAVGPEECGRAGGGE